MSFAPPQSDVCDIKQLLVTREKGEKKVEQQQQVRIFLI